jgi:hypothetical protein
MRENLSWSCHSSLGIEMEVRKTVHQNSPGGGVLTNSPLAECVGEEISASIEGKLMDG